MYVFVLKEFVLKELWLLLKLCSLLLKESVVLKARDIFQFFTAVKVESKVLINSEPVESDWGKAGR